MAASPYTDHMSTAAADHPLQSALTELAAIANSVRGKGWLDGEISGDGSLEALGSSASPLSGLDSAGLGWLTSFVSFLEEPLHHLRGNPDSLSSGAQGFEGAGTEITAAADTYRQSTTKDTEDWSGQAASGYREAGARFADGVGALGEGSGTVASAISGAAEVVAQVVGIVSGLVAEAVGRMAPIMSQAVAAAPVTFGQSIVAAIPQCVQIAVDYGQRIAGKLAALLSSGENLLKLIDGALAVMDLVKQVLSQISSQSTKGEQ
ncbi:hypothetical protein Actkin_02503 [Actinokineospora sp. UTMC 2448]|nr:hypothetical protein Actkin_02503 [Actinokineospora sp. UTMC 2448]